MSIPSLEHIAVILVEPQNPGNIGMVCRAMANFGASDLRLVNPCALRSPISSRVGSPLYLRSWGASPIEAN
jgi:tRNA C32,U32 (ribose-2'-O)-methylase TrmJ